MKQVSLILNLGITIAVAVLYYLHFAEPTTEIEENIVVDAPEPTNKTSSNSTIAYVNTDTLWDKYKLVADLENKLAGEKLKKEGIYTGEIKSLEEEYMSFQQIARGMSQEQLLQKDAEFQQKQQDLMLLQQRLEQELVDKRQSNYLEIQQTIQKRLKIYSAENGYQLILGYSAVSDLLYAPDSLEVTSTVLEFLNQEYEQRKKPIK